MEEPRPPQTTPPTQPSIPNPSNTAQNLPPHPPPPPVPPKNKKRPLDSNANLQNSKYFKMRAVLKDLRPHFIEVLRTPDFQNCKAAHEIREQMNLLMDLYKEMTAESITIKKCKNVTREDQPLPSDVQDGKDTRGPHQNVKAAEEKPVLLGSISEMRQSEDGRIVGTYVIGGSAFGWNFITFPGNKSVYYGRTKESFRTANVTPP
ncbi:uncharacterized protein LOC132299018 [Cornus florida]|uniref:uncharacterized protein LOC132299018 n=1 Tax=Cornus florida TaxID=4283 RepID=UPI00289A2272|nr:uncharacterized protein LOC132299018 [Cornus florida]